ncbi:MAG: PKD domain-containing protein [Bacteroidales bacterium]
MSFKIKIRTTTLILSYLFFIAFATFGQEITLHVSGYIADETTNNPISNHLVTLNVSGAGFTQDFEFYTNDAGYYESDSIQATGQGLIIASTLDCYEVEHFHEGTFSQNNTTFVFDFFICNDSIPQGNCENWFWYETFDNLSFNFFGESIPFPADNYVWDFGDGNTAVGQMVTHTYNINDFITVTLTTISNDPISGDSCVATSTQEIWVGSFGDCQADFEYFIDSTPAGEYLVQFTDLSIGQPENWYWDFGDGTFSEEQNPLHFYFFPGNYVVCLTISGDSANCYDQYCEEVIIGGNGDCENWFWFETNDNITFDFFGESAPLPADEWHWDFGDGNMATGQFVTHTFDPAQGEWFDVTLSTLTFDPLFGDSCIASSNQWVWVGDTLNCQANFYYVQDSQDEFIFNFFDTSSGLITNWFWDFGDGSFSEEINPTHVFTGPGTFPVCLSVFSDSLGFSCSDMFCMDVVIDYSINSNFTFSLDTLSGLPNNYAFTDISTGSAHTWNWDFGDGSSSSTQNTTHQYLASGTYEVCLEVSRNFPGFGVFSNTYCHTIVTPNYFDFGGQVFIDGFPLNNLSGDTTIVDTAMAFLYRKYDNNLFAVDTNIFFDYGYYWFSQVREGNYLIKVGLTQNSQNYKNFTSTYYGNELFWDKAQTLQLSETNYYVNIDLVDLAGIGQGPGSISGFLTEANKDFLNPMLVSEIEILLFDSDNLPLTFTYTDGSGNFTFEDLPLGAYSLYAEATGFITFEVPVLLDEDNPTLENIQLELFEQTIGIEDQFEDWTKSRKYLPQPSKRTV